MSPIGDALLGIPGVALGGGTEEGKDGDGGLKNASGLAEVRAAPKARWCPFP